MRAGNIPGAKRKDVPGGDRYHSRRSVVGVLRQREPDPQGPRGVLVLSDEPIDPANELNALAGVSGIDWVRSIGGCASFEDFLQVRDAVCCIATSMSWKEVGEYLDAEFGIPSLYLPTSYDLEDIDSSYAELLNVLRARLGEGAGEGLDAFREVLQRARGDASAALAACLPAAERGIELDARFVSRPFSLVEALGRAGFRVRDLLVSPMRVQHKEADDIGAYERLSARIPGFGARFAAQPKKSKRAARGTRSANLHRPGRFVPALPRGEQQRVPGEAAWWGYASVSELARQMIGSGTAEPGHAGRWKL